MAQSTRVLSTFSLAMITVAAIVSLRNLPLTAEFGFSSIFFLVVAAIVFFIPIALVTAELASAWPEAGGCYIWVSQAFGKPVGFFALWVAWMESIAWFPAILAFTATMLAHILQPIIPGLENKTTFVLVVMLLVFWGATISNFFGIKLSGWISSFGVIVGTLIPGVLIIGLGTWWLVSGKPSHIPLTMDALVPSFRLENVVIFSGVLLGLAGVELSAFHIRDAKDPQKHFPRAIAIASAIILGVYILGTLSIAIVVPQNDISLASGLIQAFQVFFESVGMSWFVPFLALILFIGSMAGVNTWCIGPAKGMLVVAEDGFLPPMLKRVNEHHVPITLLILQAAIGSILAMVFLYLDDNSASIWVLTALSAQFTFMQYILVFAAILKLRKSQPDVKRSYRVPLVGFVSFLGFASCVFSFLIVYIPPAQLNFVDASAYRTLLIAALVLLSLPPILLSKFRHESWLTQSTMPQNK